MNEAGSSADEVQRHGFSNQQEEPTATGGDRVRSYGLEQTRQAEEALGQVTTWVIAVELRTEDWSMTHAALYDSPAAP